jgi:hypothetical protein
VGALGRWGLAAGLITYALFSSLRERARALGALCWLT